MRGDTRGGCEGQRAGVANAVARRVGIAPAVSPTTRPSPASDGLSGQDKGQAPSTKQRPTAQGRNALGTGVDGAALPSAQVRRQNHTPGPWRVGGVNDNVVYGTEPEITLSLVVAHCNHTGEVPPEVDCANARLIAAAPIGKELADLVLSWAPSCPSMIIEKALEFAAKAEGR